MKTWFVTLRVAGGGEVFRSLKRGSREEAVAVAEGWVRDGEAEAVASVQDLRERMKTVGKGVKNG